ncbi:leucine-rich repeat protein [Butyrivibrio sp. AE2015]|uniref:leucine-rich repeat protein n=1 Tax=Butyrivibrio sp. AE2015 TaxID=1280663 RepID=UPI0003B3314C|nr:leucine-rich repeat protein [Butyrivibrio sp. AE2015]
MPFVYEISESRKDSHKFIVITGYEGSVRELVVPEEIDGYVVEAIGNHAFSGRDDIESVVLPNTIKTLYGFAFHNCRKLRKISLFDSIDDYYDGVCRQCDSLSDIEIRIERNWYEVIRNFLADNDKTLRFLTKRDEFTSCLVFPEYVYDFSENTMARTIQFSIGGSGMIYRECVDRKNVNYREYDKLFEKAVIDGNAVSEDIAIGRVLFPYELAEGYKEKYESFIKKNGKSIVERLIKNIESSGEYAAFDADEVSPMNLIKKLIPFLDDEAMDQAIKLASEKGLTLLSAVLIGSKKQSATSVSRFEF